MWSLNLFRGPCTKLSNIPQWSKWLSEILSCGYLSLREVFLKHSTCSQRHTWWKDTQVLLNLMTKWRKVVGYSDMSSNTEQESSQQLLEKKRTAKCKWRGERGKRGFPGSMLGWITLIIYLRRKGVVEGTAKEITVLQKKMANFHWV